MSFSDVNQLRKQKINSGEKWIYSAGFNVKKNLSKTNRIDEEIQGINFISDNGGIVAILSHQGGSGNDPVLHLDFIADYLSKKLKKDVLYFPENIGKSAIDFMNGLKPGQITLFGNTRFHKGEQKNDLILAKQFSQLGDFVAVGGFSKAHRKHASNVGVLNYIPGFLTESQLKEMSLLEPWCGKGDEYSVAVVGGVKKEKVLSGFDGFMKNYDVVIPGGIVLNTALAIKYGFDYIGNSIVTDSKRTFEKELSQSMQHPRAQIYLPNEVLIAKKTEQGYSDMNLIDLDKSLIPNDYSIISFVLPHQSITALERAIHENGRIVLAGTPDLHKEGFGLATKKILDLLGEGTENTLILGGDTSAELNYTVDNFKGQVSTGGGSALEYLCSGTTAVYEALKTNKQKFY